MEQSWEEYLLSEHALIERILSAVAAEIGKAEAGQADFLRLDRALNMLLEFGDKAHNAKEENHLFPMMVERGISQSGAIHNMLMDHEAERELLVRLTAKIKDLKSAPRDERSAWIKQLSEYQANRRQHLSFEGKELYPKASSVLTTDDNRRLLQAFAKIDKTLFGGKACEHFENSTQKLEKQKAGKSKAFDRLVSLEEMEAIFKSLSLRIAFAEAGGKIIFSNITEMAFFERGADIETLLLETCTKQKAEETTNAINLLKEGVSSRMELLLDLQGQSIQVSLLPVKDEENVYRGTLFVVKGGSAFKGENAGEN
jgi:hemerythrin-like domain-containing protein